MDNDYFRNGRPKVIPGTRDGVCPVAFRLKDLIFSDRKRDYEYVNKRLDEAWFSIVK